MNNAEVAIALMNKHNSYVYVIELLDSKERWVPTVSMHLTEYDANEQLPKWHDKLKNTELRVKKYARIGR